jgi:hypothetical protein
MEPMLTTKRTGSSQALREKLINKRKLQFPVAIMLFEMLITIIISMFVLLVEMACMNRYIVLKSPERFHPILMDY